MRNRASLISLACALVVATAAVLAASPATAADDPAPTLKVIPLGVDGDGVSAETRAAVMDALVSQLKLYPQFEVLPAHEGDIIELMMDHDCVDIDADCLGKIAVAKGGDRLLYVEISGSEAKGLVLKPYVYDTASGAITNRQMTAAKSEAELPAVMRQQVVNALGEPPVKGGTLVINVDNPNAQIFVDGEFAGTGTTTLERPPGQYAVRVTHDGFEDTLVEANVVAGETTTTAVEMLRMGEVAPPPPEKVDDGGGVHWAVWATIGVVVVGGVIAAVVLAGGDDATTGPRAPVTLSVDRQNAWQDAAIVGGRP